MSDTGIFGTTVEVGYKCGAGCSSTSKAEAYVNSFMTQAESEINCACRTNYSDTYSTMNVDKKGILKEAATNLAAMYAIQYDLSGFTSRAEAETMLDVLRDGYMRCLKILEDMKARDFLASA